MGWDAYALRQIADDALPLDPDMRRVFEQAAAELHKLAGEGGTLAGGELSGSASRRCLELATPIHCYDPYNALGSLCWDAGTVRLAASLACWDFGPEQIEERPPNPAPLSDFEREFYGHKKLEARLFLETCACHGFAILFTW